MRRKVVNKPFQWVHNFKFQAVHQFHGFTMIGRANAILIECMVLDWRITMMKSSGAKDTSFNGTWQQFSPGKRRAFTV